jgi:hypothetical protein
VSRPVVWWWPVLAGIGVAIALLASSSRAVAGAAATVAVVAAALAVVETVLRQRRAGHEEYDPTPTHPGGLREAFTGGGPGREDLVLACDLLERKLSRPDLRARTPPEIAALVRLPPDEFRRYVAQRLDELEASS